VEIFKLFGSIFIDNDNANESIDKTEEKGQGLSKLFGGLGGAAATAGKLIGGALLAGTGLAGVGIGAMLMAGDDLQKTLNGLQAQTGSTSGEMKNMGDSIKEIYGNNFGESFEQIGEVMANAKKITGEWGDDLKFLTQDALMFSDTFGYDTNESIRSADKIMKNFGLTGSDAMALIAEGSQKGLNYAEDLLPTIDEYSVYFKQAGFSASEMFGLFQNARSAGIFNLDYAGDAIKEFGIIMTEQGGSAAETLDNMGLNGAALQAQFAQGGDGAKKALADISAALSAEKDPQKQYSDGVALFGTKFEDVGAKGILAMTQTNDSIKGSIDVLNEINEIKYDSFGEALTGIGRQITTGIVLPLSEKVMPYLNKFSNWLTTAMKNVDMDAIVNGISSFASYLGSIFSPILDEVKANIQFLWDKFKENGGIEKAKGLFEGFKNVLGFLKDHAEILTAVLAGLGGALLTFQVLTGINKAVGLFNTLMIAMRAGTLQATLAQWGLNTALLANPFVWIAIAVGALIAAVVLLWKNWDSVSQWLSASWQWIKDMAVSVFNGIVDFFRQWGLTILAVITGPIGWLVLAIVKNWDAIKSGTISAWNAVVSFLVGIWNGISNTATGAWNGLKSGILGAWDGIKSGIGGAIDGIKGFFTGMWDKAKEIAGKIKDAFGKIFDSIKKPHFKVIGSLNPATWLKNGLPSLDIDWYAKGTNYADGGLSVVGEHGPEILDIPRGSQVKNASETRGFLDKRGGDINVQIDAKSVDLDEYQLTRIFQRLEVLYG
jgi:phage-related minor tail protein